MSEKPSEQLTPYNAVRHQQVIALGSSPHTELLRRGLAPLNFVQFKAASDPADVDISAQFLILAVDFANLAALQLLAKWVMSLPQFSGVLAIYSVGARSLTEEDLLFGVELGVKRTFFGVQRDEDLRAFVKKHALEMTVHGSMAYVASEVFKSLRRGDEAIKVQLDKLAAMDRDSEEVNRLQAILFEAIADYGRMEFHLKHTLRINPDNLWAANKLGQHYLRNRRAAEGIEILQKLSRFHELNAERLLVLGDAYLNAGRPSEASEALVKGQQLTGGQDIRFAEGLAKVDLLRGHVHAALHKVGKKYLSSPVIAFLNTRAVMATRAGMHDQGINLYHNAVAGVDPDDHLVIAKLYFNMGLAYVRSRRLEHGIDAFAKSVTVGGSQFDRACKPLSVAREILAKKTASAFFAAEVAAPRAAHGGDDIEFEVFNKFS
jgi:tetratricopeptide (TPR) repeat protein